MHKEGLRKGADTCPKSPLFLLSIKEKEPVRFRGARKMFPWVREAPFARQEGWIKAFTLVS
jgi:hypothetical protein